jgi:hypothetical protein
MVLNKLFFDSGKRIIINLELFRKELGSNCNIQRIWDPRTVMTTVLNELYF